MKLKTVFAVSCLLILAGFSFSEGTGTAQKAVRIDKEPVLDGDLQDEVWKQAAPFTGFKMVFPNPGMEPTERTELRIVFDNANLYIGVYCHDDVPSRISGNSMVHDGIGEGKADDVVRVLLDPFQDKRNAYVFIVNSRGGRSEGLASGERASLNWDGIWDARSRIRPDGWSTEMKIPFKTISFKPNLASWGINVERYIARKQKTNRLSGTIRNSFFYNPMEAAGFEGIGGVKQGLGLTFRPYGIVSGSKDYAEGTAAAWKLDGATAHIPDKGQVMVRYYGLYANALPCLRAGCAHGGRGERGIFLIFRDHGEQEFVIFRPVRGTFCPRRLFRHRFPGLLTASRGRRYITGMIKRGYSSHGAAIHRAAEKGKSYNFERWVRKSAAALLLSGRIGGRFDAIVTGASPKGTWVRLFQPPASGRREAGARFPGSRRGRPRPRQAGPHRRRAWLHRLRARLTPPS